MTFSFHPEAEEEFKAAIDYYEHREVGLGYDLLCRGFYHYPEHSQLP
jgi:hypothetical protein